MIEINELKINITNEKMNKISHFPFRELLISDHKLF